MADFRWNAWNLDHVTIHGVIVEEAESVIRNDKSPHPRYIGNGKYEVYGRGSGGRLLHVIFILDDDGAIYIIHARPVTSKKEKRRQRRKE